MAAAYGAAAGVMAWSAFRFGAWALDTAVGAWCRHQDKQSKEKTA